MRNAFVNTNIGKIKTKSSSFTSSTFIPPQISQIQSLYFDVIETVNYYPFIKISHF